jgi:hypothetical protein
MTIYSINDTDMKRILSLLVEHIETISSIMKQKGLDDLLDTSYEIVREFTAHKDLYLHLKGKYSG